MNANVFNEICKKYISIIDNNFRINFNEKIKEGYRWYCDFDRTLYLAKETSKKIFGKDIIKKDSIPLNQLIDTEAKETLEKFVNFFSNTENDCLVAMDIIKPFAEFIANYSKYYLIDVDALKNVSVYNKDDYSIGIIITSGSTKLKFEFIESAINVPGKNGFSLSSDNPLSFINDDNDTKIEFINISISAFDTVVGEYKYVAGQDYKPEVEEENIGFHYTISLATRVIFDTFTDILNNYVYILTDFSVKTRNAIDIRKLIKWKL